MIHDRITTTTTWGGSRISPKERGTAYYFAYLNQKIHESEGNLFVFFGGRGGGGPLRSTNDYSQH